MSHNKTLSEAKRLWRLGLAIHWLAPNSKRPVESGWTTGPRKTWDQLKDTYSEPLNIGVRLGEASKIDDRGFLAVVDVDVKSTEEHHRKEAIAAAKALLSGARCPVVLSGRGNGSRHYYCVTKKPFKTFTPARSKDQVKVYMPSKKPSKAEIETLTEAEIKSGMRISHAWEVSLYSEGRQVVLPPSIHPDSNRPYMWATNLSEQGSLPLVDFHLPTSETETSVGGSALITKSKSKSAKESFPGFTLSPVEIDWLELSDKMKEGIKTGKGISDRSAFLLPVSKALLSLGLNAQEIMTILTEPDTFLGACAYEHAQTKSRERAAFWVWKYTLAKIIEEADETKRFEDAAQIETIKRLSADEVEKQSQEIEGEIDWRDSLDKTGNGKYRNTFHNCRTILTHVCEQKELVGRDEFANNDFYLCDTKWMSKKGSALVDHDINRIRFWCIDHFGVEFSAQVIEAALQYIADMNRYHPIRDWLRSLKWDGAPRIDTWLKDYAGAVGPEPYLSNVSSKFLMGMVARVMDPGAKFDTILIVEGDQGTGKSTMLSKLVGPQWFTDEQIPIGEKDAVLVIQSKWLIELGELSSMSKSEIEIFKAFISRQTDRIRAPYGKRVEEFPRQCVFAGTTNLKEYLKDLTGNRRFWSVQLTSSKIDFEGIGKIREQLFAEAFIRYEKGESLYLSDEISQQQAVTETEKRIHSDEWASTIYEIITSENFPAEFEIKDVAKKMDQFGAHRLSPLDIQRIARCLKMIGCSDRRESSQARRKLWKLKIESNHTDTRPSRGPRDGNSLIDFDFY